MIETLAWILPRPRHYRSYRGGFPRHFEIKLLRLYGDPKMVLHPFGGLAEYGYAQDILQEVDPDIQADAHNMPYANESFDFVIFDPPYSPKEAIEMYKTVPIRLIKCVGEAVRVTKIGGYLALYHRLWVPRPKGTKYDKRILVCPGQWHETRICHVFERCE